MIPVYAPYLGGNIKPYVMECLDTGWISSRGTFVDRFETSFAQYVGAKDAVGVFNGTVALHLALTALGIGPGDEVIVPTFTYIASVNTILQTGAKPVFVDSLEDTLQIDPSCLRAKITPKTKAIMAVHIYGHPCDMAALQVVCHEFNLFLIEDAAEAFGTYWGKQHVGTFGDVATFSFFGNKTITTGEGGMIIARDPALIEKCRHLKSQGVSKKREYWHDVLAYNYRMTNIQAAIGLSQLELAEEILSLKRKIAHIYAETLSHLPLRTHDAVGDVKHSFWMCSILVDNCLDRDELRKYLTLNRIETRPFFSPAHCMPHCFTDEKFYVAEKVSAQGINLPSYASLREEQISHICHIIEQYFLSKM